MFLPKPLPRLVFSDRCLIIQIDRPTYQTPRIHVATSYQILGGHLLLVIFWHGQKQISNTTDLFPQSSLEELGLVCIVLQAIIASDSDLRINPLLKLDHLEQIPQQKGLGALPFLDTFQYIYLLSYLSTYTIQYVYTHTLTSFHLDIRFIKFDSAQWNSISLYTVKFTFTCPSKVVDIPWTTASTQSSVA